MDNHDNYWKRTIMVNMENNDNDWKQSIMVVIEKMIITVNDL